MLRELAGRYQLRRKLGAGAWATVYETLDTGAIGQRVAMIVFRLPPLDEGSSAAEEHARSREGARAAGHLSDPNVVSVFDYGDDAENARIVMEMAEGEMLKALLDRSGRLPAPVIARLMGQILAALAYTHSRSVVRRDTEPANIMLTLDQVVRITDFGVARIENSSMTHVGKTCFRRCAAPPRPTARRRSRLTAPTRSREGEVLRARVQTQGWPAHLHVSCPMTTGHAGNIFSTASRQPPPSSLTPSAPQWKATEPYGTDLLLVIASERSLFGGQKRRKVERLDQFAVDLAPALSAAQVVAVRTLMPRQGAQ